MLRSNLLVRLILFSSALNVFQSLLIGLNAAWITRVLDTSPDKEAQQIYDHSVKTVDRSVYPKRMYNKLLVHQTVHDVIANYNPDDGIVALPQDGLLPSEPFPWDPKKAVYVYHGYHSLHSVQVIYQTLLKLAGNRTISDHALHSLVVLWEDSLCAADPMPRSVSKNVVINDTAVAEAGQLRFMPTDQTINTLIDHSYFSRVCRDWAQVETIIRENNACFKDMGAAKAKHGMIEEWMHCPQDSPYQDMVNEYIAHAAEVSN